MEMGYPFRHFGMIDVSAFDELLDETHSLWPTPENDYRSNVFNNVHSQTLSVMFKHTPFNIGTTEAIIYPAWDAMLDQITDLSNAVTALVGLKPQLPKGLILARLYPGGVIKPHVDKHPFFHTHRRFHLPVFVPNGVYFFVDGQRVNPLERGHLFEISNTRVHTVSNSSIKHSRYHLIMDFEP